MQEHEKRIGLLAVRILGMTLAAILLVRAGERVFDIETSIARYSRMMAAFQIPRDDDMRRIQERIAALTALLPSTPTVHSEKSDLRFSDIGLRVRTLSAERGMALRGFRTVTNKGEPLLECEATGPAVAVLGFLSDLSNRPDGLSIQSVRLVASTSGTLDAVIGMKYETK